MEENWYTHLLSFLFFAIYNIVYVSENTLYEFFIKKPQKTFSWFIEFFEKTRISVIYSKRRVVATANDGNILLYTSIFKNPCSTWHKIEDAIKRTISSLHNLQSDATRGRLCGIWLILVWDLNNINLSGNPYGETHTWPCRSFSRLCKMVPSALIFHESATQNFSHIVMKN